MKRVLQLTLILLLIATYGGEQKTEQVQAQPAAVITATAENAPSEQTAVVALPEPKPDPEAEAKAFIYSKESGNRTDAINPSSGACGIGQAWPCSKLPCTLQDYECQDRYFTSYMQSRYGSWQNAKAFWLSKCSGSKGCWW